LRVAIPDWVLSFVEKVAKEVLQGSPTAKHTIGLTGRGGGHSLKRQRRTQERDAAIVWAVYEQQQAGRIDEIAFSDVAAQFKLQPTTVRNIYHAWIENKSFFPRKVRR
jgi:hypothetical protein